MLTHRVVRFPFEDREQMGLFVHEPAPACLHIDAVAPTLLDNAKRLQSAVEKVAHQDFLFTTESFSHGALLSDVLLQGHWLVEVNLLTDPLRAAGAMAEAIRS